MEKGHAADLHLGCLCLYSHDARAQLVAVQGCQCRVPVETNFVGQVQEDCLIANIAAFLELGLEQRLGECLRSAQPLGARHQHVGLPGVGRALHPVELELDAFLNPESVICASS